MPDSTPFRKKNYAALVQELLADVRVGSGGRTALSDAADGSVVRTLLEAFARELAVCYEQLEHVHRNGYLETAEGAALDRVVALLGVERRRAGHLEGRVTFARRRPAAEDIPIIVGTSVTGRDVPVFETTKTATLAAGSLEVSVPVRSIEPGEESVAPGLVTIMPKPLLGIESVANLSELVTRRREETDDELRERARTAIYRGSPGTRAAIEEAVRTAGFVEFEIREDLEDRPGEVEVVLGDAGVDEEAASRVQDAVRAVRPAGVHIRVTAATEIPVGLAVVVEIDAERPAAERQALRAELIGKLVEHFTSLHVGERVRWATIRSILTAHEFVRDLHPFEDDPRLLRPRLPGSADPAGYLQENGDLHVGERERAILDLERAPVVLTIEPPALPVHVRLRLVFEHEDVIPSRAAIEDAVTGFLEKQVTRLAEEGTSVYFSLGELVHHLEQRAITGHRELVLTLSHERDGRERELSAAEERERLDPRERPQLDAVEISTGSEL